MGFPKPTAKKKIEEVLEKGNRFSLERRSTASVIETKGIWTSLGQRDLTSNPYCELSQSRGMTYVSLLESDLVWRGSDIVGEKKKSKLHNDPTEVRKKKMVESFADKVSVEKLEIVRLKREIGRRALQGKYVR